MKKHSYAQQLANPGLRSKLPDSKLTPQLLKKRQANTAAKARLQPFVPGSSITVGQVARDRKANEQLKFGSVDSQYARTGQQIPVWFADYQRQIAAGQAASQARYAQAQSELAARTAASQAAADQSNTQTTQAQSADAASRGATPNAQVSAEANQAQASRRALSDAFASAITG